MTPFSFKRSPASEGRHAGPSVNVRGPVRPCFRAGDPGKLCLRNGRRSCCCLLFQAQRGSVGVLTRKRRMARTLRENFCPGGGRGGRNGPFFFRECGGQASSRRYGMAGAFPAPAFSARRRLPGNTAGARRCAGDEVSLLLHLQRAGTCSARGPGRESGTSARQEGAASPMTPPRRAPPGGTGVCSVHPFRQLPGRRRCVSSLP